MKAADCVAQLLKRNGITRIFGLMGDVNFPYIGAWVAAEGKYTGMVTEAGAVGAADGHSRYSVGPGVATVTCGPGITNSLTALTEAVRAHSRVLVLTGDPPPKRDHRQALDIRAAVAITGAKYREVSAPETLAADLQAALTDTVFNSRPTVLNIPVGIALGEVPPDMSVAPQIPAPAAGIPEDSTVDRGLGILVNARRPIILAGFGAVVSGAAPDLVRLAELTGGRLATTLAARGLFEGHPLDLGLMGTLSDPRSVRHFQEADCIVAFGASLNTATTSDDAFLRGAAVVRCDLTAQALADGPPLQCGIVGDARLTANLMVSALRQGDHSDRAPSAPTEAPTPAPPHLDAGSSTAGLDTRVIMRELSRALPQDRAVITDAGRFVHAAWRYFDCADPAQFAHTVHFGSVGLGLAVGIGAALANPSKLTVVLAGDGGVAYQLMELMAAAAERTRLVVLVFNNRGYGAEFHKMRELDLDPAPSLLTWPDLAPIAIAAGAKAISVRSSADVAAVSQAIEAGRHPLFVEVECDVAVNAGLPLPDDE